MRMRKFCCTATLFFVLVLASLTGRSQLFIGAEGGLNKNYLTTSNASEPFTNYVGMSGWNVGIPIGYQFFDWMALIATPTYITKNYDIVRTGFFTGVYQKNYNNYIQLPLKLRFSFGGKELRGFVDLGGYAGYWMSGRIKGTEANILNESDTVYENVNPTSVLGENYPYSYDQKYTFDNTRDNRMEFGLVGGAGISYELFETYTIFVEGHYYRALTDQEKHYQMNQAPRYNDNFGLSLGCTVKFKSILSLFKR